MWAEFIIEGEPINVQCQENDTIENAYLKCLTKIQKKRENDIVFVYNGKVAETGLQIKDIINREDRNRKKLSIITDKSVSKTLKHKNIICPECFSEADLEFKDYKINLICENGHINNNLSVSEFRKKQEIDSSNIKCDECKKANLSGCLKGEFKRCVKCRQNICIECLESHLKLSKQKHNKYCIVDYNIDNYECCIHKKPFISFCESCQKDLCQDCKKKDHNKHRILEFNKILPDKNGIIIKKEKLKTAQKTLIEQIDSLIKCFNHIKVYMESYNKLISDILDGYDPMKINYKMINNIKSINFDETINDLKHINFNDKLINKFQNIMNLYCRMRYSKEITLKYKINKNDKKIKIFGDEFVRNNEHKCKISIDGKDCDLKSEIYLNKDFQRKKSKIFIVLKDVNKINNMDEAFKDTSLLSSPDLAKLDTTNVDSMRGAFQNCFYLEDMQELEWDVKNVRDMSYLFSGCINMKYISFKNWQTGKIQDMSYIFHDDRKLRCIDGLKQFETSNVKNLECMCSGCSNLEKIDDISDWKTSNLESMGEMFKGCHSLTGLPDISNWDISHVKDIHEIFYGCQNLTTLPDISKWQMNNIENIYGLFNGYSSLTSIPNISNWQINKVTDLSELFAYCTNLLELPDISGWDVSNVTNLSKIFFNCLSLRFLPDINKWNIINVVNMREMFSKCINLFYLPDISSWNTSNVKYIGGIFNECKQLCYIPNISNWNMKKALELDFMFNECINLRSIPDINNWELNKEASINLIFNNCYSLNSIPDFSHWGDTKFNYIKSFFYQCQTLINIPDIFKTTIDNNVPSLNLNKSNSYEFKIPDFGFNLIGFENLDYRHKRFSEQVGMIFPSMPY